MAQQTPYARVPNDSQTSPSEQDLINFTVIGPGGVRMQYFGSFGMTMYPQVQPRSRAADPSEGQLLPGAAQPDTARVLVTQPSYAPPEPTEPGALGAPTPGIFSSRALLLAFKVSFVAIYATIAIMQIVCLSSSGWTESGRTLEELSKDKTVVKIAAIVMILMGITSLLSNVALSAIAVWMIITTGKKRPYSIFRKLLPVSIFPWIIGLVVQEFITLATGKAFGPTDKFAIAIFGQLFVVTIYVDWARSKLVTALGR